MKKYVFSESVMFRWKQIVVFSLCVIGFSSDVFAETTLIIGTGELPPFTSAQPENSILTDVFKAIEKEMGVKFVFQFLPWKRCEQYVEELKVWGTIPYVRTPGREQKYDFSEPIFQITTNFFGYASDGKMKNISYAQLSELKNYKIGGVRGYWYEKMFHDAEIGLELVPRDELNVRKLRAGRIDLALFGETGGWHMIKTLFPHESGNFFTVMPPLLVKDNFLMTSKQYPDGQKLLTEFNTALKKIKGNGVFQKILDKRGVVLTY